MNFAWIKPVINRARSALVKNAPHILMGMGTTGSVTAMIFAVKAVPAAQNAIRQATEESDSDYTLTAKEKLKACWKYYIPAVGLELFSLGCFWGAHGIDMKRQAILAGLYSTAETALQEYQRKVVEMIGKDGEREIRKSIGQDKIEVNPPENTVILAGDTDLWCLYDDQYFKSSYLKIKEAQNDANHHMIQHMYISKLELEWLLDPDRRYLRPMPNDGQVGWSLDRQIVLDVQSALGPEHVPVLLVTVTDKDGIEYPPEAGFCMLH